MTVIGADHHRKRKAWTHTNSDSTCLQDDDGFLQRALYVVNLHTALSMFNRNEKIGCYIAAFSLLMVTVLYTVVFVKGLVDGFSVAMMEKDAVLGL